MTGPTTTPKRPASSAAMRDRKRSALSLLLSTKPRRLFPRSPSRGAGGMGEASSATVGSSANRMFSAPDQAVGYYWIQSNPNGDWAQRFLPGGENCSRPLPQQSADHLAGGGHRHLVDEGDLARIFMRGEPRLHEILDFGGERLRRRMSGIEHDESLHDL